MELTVRAKKLIAFFLVISIVLPLTSSFGLWDAMVDNAYATGTADDSGADADDGAADDEGTGDGEGEAGAGGVIDTRVDEYHFYNTADVDMYNYDVSFTYDGTEYNGLFRNELKSGSVDNTELGLDSLGTIDDPYVIMELAPNPAKTEIRAYVKDSGLYSLTQAEKKNIVLTADEIQEVYEDTVEYLFYKKFGKTFSFLNSTWMPLPANSFNDDPEFDDFFVQFPYPLPNGTTLDDYHEDMMKFFAEHLEGFDAEFEKRKNIALNAKVTKEESDRVRLEYAGASFKSAYQYGQVYKVVEDPEAPGYFMFDTHSSAGTKTSVLGNGSSTNCLAGEYKLEFGDYNASIYQHSNLFIKGCLDLAYETHIEDGIIVDEQKPFIDEYIFAGWYYMDENDKPQRVQKDTDFKKLGIKDLYTYWTARGYASSDSYQVGTGTANDVVLEMGDFNIHLPGTLASRPTAEDPWHDERNQVSFVKLDAYTGVVWYGPNYMADVLIPLQDEITGWDMTFTLKEYPTGKELLRVAPKLMADTDYYIATYNTTRELNDAGEYIVEYYPYNVQVVTVTPEDLNKMVYYDYARNGWSADEYHDVDECTYLSKFLNDIDLVYITNGNNVTYNKQSPYDVCKERFPTFYTEDGEFLSREVDFSSKMQDNKIPDIEWQVAMKIYLRALDDTQMRRIATVYDRTVYSAKANIDGGATESNLDKLSMLWFMAVEPSFLYKCYVVPDKEIVGDYNFDRLTGTTREETYRTTNYTGRLYDQTAWNGLLFYPYEVLGIDHYQAVISGKLGTDLPWGNDITLMYEYFATLGIAYNFQPTTIVNNYARSFIGGNQLGQQFADKTIAEEINETNNSNSNNTGLMFDYFDKVRPDAIINGNLSTENAIEFMVQNVRNKTIQAYDRRITILNKVDPQERIDSIKVDRVIADLSMPTEWVQFNFTTSVGGYYVAEIYWTPKFQDIDNDNVWAGTIVLQCTTSSNPDERWVKMPNSDANKDYYKTFLSSVSEEGDLVAGEESVRILSDGTAYQFEGEVQPAISYKNAEGTTVNRTGAKGHYVIVVRKYKSEEAYLKGEKPIKNETTTKNVTLEKMTHLFNLD